MKLFLNSTSIGLIALSTLVAIGCGRNSGTGDPRYNDPYYQPGGGGYRQGAGGGGVVTGGVAGGGVGGGYGGQQGGPQGPGGYSGGGPGGLCSIQAMDDSFDRCNITVEERRMSMKKGFFRSAGTAQGVYPNIFRDQKFLAHYKITRQETQCLQTQMCGGGPGQQQGGFGGGAPQGRGYPGGYQQPGYPEQPGPQPGPVDDGYQPFEPDQADLPESRADVQDGYDQEEPQQRASRPRRGR